MAIFARGATTAVLLLLSVEDLISFSIAHLVHSIAIVALYYYLAAKKTEHSIGELLSPLKSLFLFRQHSNDTAGDDTTASEADIRRVM